MGIEFKHTTLTSKTTGIAASSITSTGVLLSSEIDNTGGDTRLTLDASFVNVESNMSVDDRIDFYIICAPDGTNYETASADTLEGQPPVASYVVTESGLDAVRRVFNLIPIPPSKFKIAVKHNVSEDQLLTLTAYTYNEKAVLSS
jgi:hypothetical protein